MTVRVLVVDDQELIRAGFAALLDVSDGIEVVGEAADGARAVELARELRPDVVVMDLRMPGTDGISATAQIAGDPALGDVHVLVLTTFEDDEHVLGALRAGAAGFLGKGVRPQVLVDAVRTVAAGESLLSPTAMRSLVARAARSEPRVDGDVFRSLTDREREAVLLVAQGMSNDEIAASLHVTPLTAKTHVNRAMAKLGARDRAQLVVLAYRSGLAAHEG
ncbi:response regulator [Oerskovia sp. NPDC057915]|uniref:response regulator transcription factor n=1 Tax=Oerskovia sp. NPDC057915 TaxID=3346280 RepID=UPI0036DABD21